jgi:hypothetical protein
MPIVSVDTDAASGGIQPSDDVTLGETFQVNVFISDVENLQAFELDLGYDATVLTALSVQVGDFMIDPVFSFGEQLGPPAEIQAATLGLNGASGDGVLVEVVFQATGVGTTELLLGDVKLSQPFGVRIEGATLENGVIRVAEAGGEGAIPEPSAALVFAGGWLLVAGAIRRRGSPGAPGRPE